MKGSPTKLLTPIPKIFTPSLIPHTAHIPHNTILHVPKSFFNGKPSKYSSNTSTEVIFDTAAEYILSSLHQVKAYCLLTILPFRLKQSSKTFKFGWLNIFNPCKAASSPAGPNWFFQWIFNWCCRCIYPYVDWARHIVPVKHELLINYNCKRIFNKKYIGLHLSSSKRPVLLRLVS